MDEQIRRLVSAAPPGSRVAVILIETPGRAMQVRVDGLARAQDGSEAAAHGAMSAQPQPSTALERLEAHAERSGEALTAAGWGRVLIDVPMREIERAVKAGALKEAQKGFGRDHRARVITVTDMREYVSICAQVAQGHMPSPAWWHNVRKGENASIVA